MGKVETVNRNIYFFRIKAKFGSRRYRNIKKTEFLEQINKLKFYTDPTDAIQKADSRYVPLPTSDNTAMGIWNFNDSKYEFILSKLRRDQLPQKVKGENIQDLKLGKEDWLGDSIHIKFFEDGLFGAEMNGYSVTPNRIGFFLQYRLQQVFGEVLVMVLTNTSYKSLLNNLKDVRYFEVQVHKNILDQIEANKKLKKRSIADYLRKSFEFYESDTIAIKYGSARGISNTLSMKNFKDISCILDVARLRPFIEKFKVKGKYYGSTKSEEKDFLETNLSFSKKIVKVDSRNRKIDDKSMFEAIEKTYNEHRNLIRSAHGISQE